MCKKASRYLNLKKEKKKLREEKFVDILKLCLIDKINLHFKDVLLHILMKSKVADKYIRSLICLSKKSRS